MNLDVESLDPNSILCWPLLQIYFVAHQTHLWLKEKILLATVANQEHFLVLAQPFNNTRYPVAICIRMLIDSYALALMIKKSIVPV